MGNNPHQTKNKKQLDIMSTGLISPFHLTAMTVTKPKMQQKQRNTNKTQQNLDQVLVMTITTLLEKDIKALLDCLFNAMQAKNLINNSTAPGSQITGLTK